MPLELVTVKIYSWIPAGSPSLLTDRGFGEMPDLPADSATS